MFMCSDFVPFFFLSMPVFPNKWYHNQIQLGGGAGVGSWYWIKYKRWKLTLERELSGFQA